MTDRWTPGRSGGRTDGDIRNIPCNIPITLKKKKKKKKKKKNVEILNIDYCLSLARRTLYSLINTGVHGSNGLNPRISYKMYSLDYLKYYH